MTARVLAVPFFLFLAGFGQISLGDICSLIAPDDIASCGSKNISKTSCEAMGCCWKDAKVQNTENDSNLRNIHCYRSKIRNGTCIQYPEDGICYKYLNNSVPQFRDSLRFIDYRIGLNRTNRILENFHHLVDVIAKDEFSTWCLDKIRKLLCHYILAPCSEDGYPIQICRRDCDRYEEECPRTLQKLIGGARFALDQMDADFVHVQLPECENFLYEKDLAKEGKKCLITGFFNDTGNESENEKSAILAVIVVVPAILVICLIVFFLYRRRKKRDEHAKLDPGTPRTNPRILGMFPSISVKDHINKLTADDLLKSKISITDPKQIKQYPVDMIAYEKDLGEGQFGQVFQGRAVGLNENEPEGEVVVAVKTLKKGSSIEAKDDFDQEACLMNYLSHPNIVKLLAVSAMEEPYCMIFEFMSKGDLSEYLRKSKPLVENMTEAPDDNKNFLSQETLINMGVDVAKGLQYLASHRLIHRDVATRNCLVADDLTIKIADFGMSRDIYANNYYKIERETVLPIRWLSPEAVMFGKFTVESDVYSYGVLLWEIFTFSMQPYYGYTNKEVLEFIAKGVHLGKPEFCPEFVYKVMKDCWRKEPESRPLHQSIIDRLRGKEITYDHPKTWLADKQPDTVLYQNVPLHENEPSDDPESGGNDEPLIATPISVKKNDERKSLCMASNPLFQKTEQQNADKVSHGSTNTAMDSDSEREDAFASEGDNEETIDVETIKKLSLKKDSDGNRMNKTYV